jgi:Rac GTPase-activating protein 1
MLKQPSSHHNNLHIMTPIIEAQTPGPSHSRLNELREHQSAVTQRLYSNYNSNSKRPNATPSQPNAGVKTTIPLARKYKRPHIFKGQVILNSELCAHCDKRTKFGKMIMKCRECDMVVHSECRDVLQRACYPMFSFPAQGLIGEYVSGQDESPHVPPILQMLVHEIETRGLLAHEVGLYRVNGSDSQIKQLKERLIKRHQPPDLRKINDVHVLCSFVKDFLNNFLTEHLITYDSWFRFAKACG